MIFHSEEARRCSFTIAELKIMWGKCHPCTELKEVSKRGPLEAPWLHHVAIKPVISSAPLQLHVLYCIRESSYKQKDWWTEFKHHWHHWFSVRAYSSTAKRLRLYFCRILGNGWHKLVPAYKATKLSARSRKSTGAPNKSTMWNKGIFIYCIIHHLPHQETSNSCFQWSANWADLTITGQSEVAQ